MLKIKVASFFLGHSLVFLYIFWQFEVGERGTPWNKNWKWGDAAASHYSLTTGFALFFD